MVSLEAAWDVAEIGDGFVVACHDMVKFMAIHHECVRLPVEEMLNVNGGETGCVKDTAGPNVDRVGCPMGDGFGITNGVEVKDCDH